MRKEVLNNLLKLGILFFIIFCFVGIFNLFSHKTTGKDSTEGAIDKKALIKTTLSPTKIAEPSNTIPEKKENLLISRLVERPLINGSRTKRIGTYGYVSIVKDSFDSLVTDDILLEFNKYVETTDCNYVIIDFNDGTYLEVLGGVYDYCLLHEDEYGDYNFENNIDGKYIYVDNDRNNVVWTDYR